MPRKKRQPKKKAAATGAASVAAVGRGEAARIWRRDMTIELETLISEADATSARAVDAALRIRDLLAKRPKL